MTDCKTYGHSLIVTRGELLNPPNTRWVLELRFKMMGQVHDMILEELSKDYPNMTDKPPHKLPHSQ